MFFFFFSSRRRHTRWPRDWSSDVCSSDLTNDDDITSLRHLGRRPPKIFENFERREPSGSAHDSAARMGRRSAHVAVLNRGAELRPARYRAQEEKLLEREFSLEDVAFTQPPLALEVERRDNLLVKNYVFDVRRVLGNCVDNVIAERFFLIVPIQTGSQLIGRVLHEARKNMLAWRSHRRIGQRRDDHVDVRAAGEIAVLGVVVSLLHIFHAGRNRNRAAQMRAWSGHALEIRQAVQREIYFSRRPAEFVAADFFQESV